MDNTMIIFTTDNGYYHAEHGLADKFYAHQESIRVPLIIKDPRMDKKKIGTQNDDFTLSIDLAPTMLKAAGVDVPQRMQGVDMSPLYKPKEKSSSWRDQFYYEYPGIPGNSAHIRVQALVRKDYKYMFWLDEDYEQLYHIPTDRYEQHDLARNFTYKAQLEEMRKAFKAEQSDAQ
jgi:arylsulfatase A-like enzyme